MTKVSCPRCNSKNQVKILYGLIRFEQSDEEKIKKTGLREKLSLEDVPEIWIPQYGDAKTVITDGEMKRKSFLNG